MAGSRPTDTQAGVDEPGGTAGLTAWVERRRRKLESGSVGHLQQRIAEMHLINQAMILAALALTSVIPLLITLSAVVPLGDTNGAAAGFAHRLGLSAQATKNFQSLLGSRSTVRGATTVPGAVLALLAALAWPAALQRGYELAWGLGQRGWRDRWRSLLWLAVSFAGLAALVGADGSVRGAAGKAAIGLAALPVTFGWAWWTQHLLLGGRVGWRPLLGGAIAITVGLYALRLLVVLTASPMIEDQYRQYGPVGVVFVLLSWLIGFSAVMLGGAVVGAALHERRHGHSSTESGGPHRPDVPAAGP